MEFFFPTTQDPKDQQLLLSRLLLLDKFPSHQVLAKINSVVAGAAGPGGQQNGKAPITNGKSEGASTWLEQVSKGVLALAAQLTAILNKKLAPPSSERGAPTTVGAPPPADVVVIDKLMVAEALVETLTTPKLRIRGAALDTVTIASLRRGSKLLAKRLTECCDRMVDVYARTLQTSEQVSKNPPNLGTQEVPKFLGAW